MEKLIQYPKAKKNKIGEHYGHWIVKKQNIEESAKQQRVVWLCECDCGCGTTKSIRTDALNQVTIGGCSNMTGEANKICAKCGKKFAPKKQAKTRRYCYQCQPEEEKITGTSTRKLIKRWALEYKGNKCSCCGYDTCSQALEFHHLNMSEKDFSISDRDIKLDWDSIKKELDKCIVVCSNCHREIHAGIRIVEGGED